MKKDVKFRKAKELTEQIGAIAQVPGGLEMLMTAAAEHLGGPKGGKSKQIRLYSMGGAVTRAEGGLAQAAELTRQGGRGDDEMLLHVSPEEYEAITSMWGEPDINPDTGIPEYGFLSKLFKGVKKVVKKIVKSPVFSVVAPIALSVFAPGLGTALGGALGATGKAAATIGNTLIRGGIGAVSGGKTGAISGVLSGLTSSGIGGNIGKKLGLKGATARIAGDSLLGGAAGAATGVGFKQGAIGQGATSLLSEAFRRPEEGVASSFAPETGEEYGFSPVTPDDPFGYGVQPPAVAPGGLTVFDPASAISSVAAPSLWDKITGFAKDHPFITAGGALALLGAGSSGGGRGGGNGTIPQLPPRFDERLQSTPFNRTALTPDIDYYNYGRSGGEELFFSDNSINSGVPFALGGLVRKYQSGGHVKGEGTGRSDSIPAVLSDGEYVIDSETVALLGDGSTDAGARRLDEMRKKLRMHKGGNLAKGKFSAAAKLPEQYLAEGGSVNGGSALKELKSLAVRFEHAITSGNKKRIAEISAQLNSLDGGSDIISKLSKGGKIKKKAGRAYGKTKYMRSSRKRRVAKETN